MLPRAKQLPPLILLCLWTLFSHKISAQPESPIPSQQVERQIVVISDLHMGLGRDAQGRWHPSEDFRWPVAFEAFLAAIDAETEGGIDLLIAGDFLELWQRPDSISCSGPPPSATGEAQEGEASSGNFGCSVDELVAITELVVAAHARELSALARFAAKPEHCVIVVPGNHDAGLVLDGVWKPVAKALRAADGCVQRVSEGIWTSTDGGLAVEHGHQIGWDANKYDQWPSITQRFGDHDYVWQPWGEGFVQAIFNAEEADFPLIDNLSPSSAGVRYRMAERGFSGSAQDVARFVRFNLFDTSIRQKLQILSGSDTQEDADREDPYGDADWDLKKARALEHQLFLGGFEAGDPLAQALLEDEAWKEVREELATLAHSLPDQEIASLCDQLAMRQHPQNCERAKLGLAASSVMLSRKRIMRSHLEERRKDFPRLKKLVYGHTHAFELPWELVEDAVTSTSVANSGAFQRLMDDVQLRDLAASEGLTPGEYLSQNRPEDLPACYTSVHLAGPKAKLEVRAWYMPEDAASGRFVDPCKAPCARVGHGCEN